MKSFKNPALTVDIVIFSVIDKKLKVLLIQRKYPPFENQWAIPGGFVEYDEDVYAAAKRELEEETCVSDIALEQFHTFGELGRDPRGRTVSVAYLALANVEKLSISAHDDAKNAGWFSIKELPELAFDHKRIIECALINLREKIENTPIVSSLLPQQFTIADLQKIYEIILDRKIDDGRFKCEILKMGFIEKAGTNTYSFKKDAKTTSRFF